MKRILNISLASLVLALGTGVAGTNAASASQPPTERCEQGYAWKKVTTWKTVWETVAKQVPVENWVTKYDSYGCAYRAHVTTWKTEWVKVPREVPVVSWVKVRVQY